MNVIDIKSRLLVSSFLLLIVNFFSCQTVIDIDLNSADPQIVIQGKITNQSGPYSVKITRTVNYNETNTFPPVSDAIVKITDNVGNTDLLTETSPGIYTTATIQGVPGRSYTLSVTTREAEYISTSTMPFPAAITKLEVRKSDFTKDKVVDVFFNDSAGVDNYYRLIQSINWIEQEDDLDIFDDELTDGQEITYTMFTSGEENELKTNDTVLMELQTIDEGAFEFFRTSDQAVGGSQSPANPNSNISHGALGYFSAYSVSFDSTVVK